MSDTEAYRNDLKASITDMPSRMIVVCWVGVIGFVQLSLASAMVGEIGGLERGINVAYAGIGGLMPVYILYPIFNSSVSHIHMKPAKVASLITGAGMAGSMMWMTFMVINA